MPDNRITDHLFATRLNRQGPQPIMCVGALTSDDEVMLQELERSNVSFIDSLVDELWGERLGVFGPQIDATDERASVESVDSKPLYPTEETDRDIACDWTSTSRRSDRRMPDSDCVWNEYCGHQCPSADYALLISILTVDSYADIALCQAATGINSEPSKRLEYCYLFHDCGWIHTWPAECRAGERFLSLSLASREAVQPSRLWRMIDEVAKTFQVDTYDAENVIRILLGSLGKRVLFAGLDEQHGVGDRRNCRSTVHDFFRDIRSCFIEYFREWSSAVATSGFDCLADRSNRDPFLGSRSTRRLAVAQLASPLSVRATFLPNSQMGQVVMPKVTFYPLGNADTVLIDLANGKKVLFDYAATRDPDDDDDKRTDLTELLRSDLDAADKDDFDVVAITHLDDDHTHGADEFFHLDHAKKFQSDDRIKIETLWVPAAVITEDCDDLEPGAEAIQDEARHRLKTNYGIRVFSRPDALKTWLEKQGLSLEKRKHLITDAGNLAPELTLANDGVEFFVHSPFGWRQDDSTVIDRNGDSLVMQASFKVADVYTKLLLASDVDHTALADIVTVTKKHKREDRLEWDIAKLPHHCSYLTLGPERGKDKTEPVDNVKWLFETQGQRRCYIISTSKPIPEKGSDEDKGTQPPHRQAANYYRDVASDKDGEFKVTMEHPKTSAPEPIEIEIAAVGANLKKRLAVGASAITRTNAPRAG